MTPEQIADELERLAQRTADAGDENDYRIACADVATYVRRNKDAIARALRAAAKLPITDDGIRITDGTVTFCDSSVPFPHEWAIRDRDGKRYADHCKHERERHYSTREAADAAKGKK